MFDLAVGISGGWGADQRRAFGGRRKRNYILNQYFSKSSYQILSQRESSNMNI